MTYSSELLDLVDQLHANINQLKSMLDPGQATPLADAVGTHVLPNLPYPYRAWGLNDAVRRQLPGTTTRQIHGVMRQLGFRRTRDQVSIIWIKA